MFGQGDILDVMGVGFANNSRLREAELDGVGLGLLHLILNDIGDLLDAGDTPGSAAGAGNLVEGIEVNLLHLLVVVHLSTPSGHRYEYVGIY